MVSLKFSSQEELKVLFKNETTGDEAVL